MNAELKWLDDPEVFRVNCVPAHSDHRFFLNSEEAEEGKSVLTRSLNGMWKFKYSENAASRPVLFYQEEFDTADFDEMKVPCHIEMAGYDKIHYINTMYPWEAKYYRRPAGSLNGQAKWQGMFSEAPYNPVGSYVKEFDLEEAFLGKRITICFEGVEQALYLWLNGSFVGYAEDSFTPSEFDLTPYVKEKGNVLCVEVHKRSTAAFLEDQDFFRFFGIFRDVTLYAKPEMHVEDFWAKPVLSEDGTGSLALDMKLSMPEGAVGRAEISLTDKEGNEVLGHNMLLPGDVRGNVAEVNGKGYREIPTQMSARNLGKVNIWDNHTPYLYTLTICLYDSADRLVEVVPYRIGFRRFEMIDKVMYLNGKRFIINGVNRHEWNPESGRCITKEDMVSDMQCFLRNNINAVRTCHYPDQIAWYYMCDENGIYMMSETNMETHGSWQKNGAPEPSWNVPGSLPEWKEAVLDRARNNFETFKNHTSVLFWSLGNESFVGDDIAAMNAYFKEKQDGRLVHYEGVCMDRSYEDVVSDVESRMYASPDEVREYLDNNPKKPYILCEYMHDMGNSLGGFDSYIKLLDEYDMYQGGFIWDFIDQAIYVEDEVTGRKVLRYGGDFDDRPADYEFSGNGIVFADRTEKPAMQEVRYCYGLHK
jgi:beta-galactosidase